MNYPENGRETTKIAPKYGPDWGAAKIFNAERFRSAKNQLLEVPLTLVSFPYTLICSSDRERVKLE